MPLFHIKIDKNQLKQATNWLGRMESSFMKAENMEAGVKHVGIAMMSNFASEGSKAGHPWSQLSQFTQRVRRRRGYDPKHPILVQSGGLRDITAFTLATWHVGQGAASKADGDGTIMSASAAPLKFHAKVSGPKVANHWGGTVRNPRRKPESGYEELRLPKRPFFGITDDAANKAFEAIMDRMMINWGKSSRNTKRLH